MSDGEFKPKVIQHTFNRFFLRIPQCPQFPVAFESETQSTKSVFRGCWWGISYLTRRGSRRMSHPRLKSRFRLHEGSYSDVSYRPQPCENHTDQSYTSPCRTLPWSIPVVRPTAVCSALDRTVIGLDKPPHPPRSFMYDVVLIFRANKSWLNV